MKLRSHRLLSLIAWCLTLVLRCWFSTIRYRRVSPGEHEHPVPPSQQSCIYAFWHENILAPLSWRVKSKILISQHADGELIAQVARRFGYCPVRGSSTRGGSAALRQMMSESCGEWHMAFTPDGPRGPRRQMQVGTVATASATGEPIVLIGIGYSRAWRLRSWDHFAVPLPFSTVTAVFSEPLYVPADLSRAELEAWRQRVEREFLRITELAEDWGELIHKHGRAAVLPPTILVPARGRAA